VCVRHTPLCRVHRLSPPPGVERVCLPAFLSVCQQSRELHVQSLPILCTADFLRPRCDTICTSSIMDYTTFAHNGPHEAYRSIRLQRVTSNIWKRTHCAWSSFKSLRNQYHKLIPSSKKEYFSSLVSLASNNPKRLWQTVNKLLHRKSSSPLPTISPATSLADSFASFFH